MFLRKLIKYQTFKLASLSLLLSSFLLFQSNAYADGLCVLPPKTGNVPIQALNPDYVYPVSHKQIAPGHFIIFDNEHQSWVVVGSKAVAVVGLHSPLSSFIVDQIRQITTKPVKYIIYNTSQYDSLASAPALKAAFPQAKIIAQTKTNKVLADYAQATGFPLADITFDDSMTLDLGDKKLELDYRGNIFNKGVLFVYSPQNKILMVPSVVQPGWAPFRSLNYPNDVAKTIQGIDKILKKYDFDIFLGSFAIRVGNKADVVRARNYYSDLLTTVRTILPPLLARFFSGGFTLDDIQKLANIDPSVTLPPNFALINPYGALEAASNEAICQCVNTMLNKPVRPADVNYPGATWGQYLGGVDFSLQLNCDRMLWSVFRDAETQVIN